MLLKSAILLAGLAAAVPVRRQSNTTVTPSEEVLWSTQQWTYNGLRTGSIDAWLGVPFAQQPTGQRRFKAPQAFSPNDPVTMEIRGAQEYGVACPQPPGFFEPDQIGEECLTLNVWRPANTSNDAKLPIHVFFPGGGFLLDAARSYNGSVLVQRSIETDRPIIVVTANYRLGLFGFLSHPELPEEDFNAGLLDSLAALRFIKLNLAAIGGDPDRVVISGQSAGSMAVASHMLWADPEQDLFQGVIAMSGVPNARYTPTPAFYGATAFDPLAQSLSCGTNTTAFSERIDCLRNASYDSLITANSQFAFNLGLGGYVRKYPQDAVLAGEISSVPLIAGLTMDEGTTQFSKPTTIEDPAFDFTTYVLTWLISYGHDPTSNSTAQKVARMLELFPNDVSQGSPYNTGNETFGFPPVYKRVAAFLGDLAFDAGVRDFRKAASQRAPTWAYQYAAHLTNSSDPATAARNGIFHGIDLVHVFPSIFQDSGFVGNATYDTDFQDFFIAFTHDLDPTRVPSNPLLWPQYQGDNPEAFVFGDNATSAGPDVYRAERLAYISENILSSTRTGAGYSPW